MKTGKEQYLDDLENVERALKASVDSIDELNTVLIDLLEHADKPYVTSDDEDILKDKVNYFFMNLPTWSSIGEMIDTIKDLQKGAR